MADAREEQGDEVDNPSSRIFNPGHPLLNQVVASTIFEVVPLPQLRSLRIVCKDWYSTSLPIWRRKVQINIHHESSNQRLLQWKSLGSELDVAGEKPFRNFRLHSPQFLPDISRQFFMVDFRKMSPPEGTYENMERFWANYGHWIHKLELKDVFVKDVEAFKRAIFEQTPNLQELTLDVHDGRSGWEVSYPWPVQNMEDKGPAQPNLNLKVLKNLKDSIPTLPFGWSLLFNHFPNIQKLECADEPMEDCDKFVDCLEEMLRNPTRPSNLPLTDLRLTNFAGNDVQRILGMPLVKLKVFHLSICYMKDDELDVFQTAMQFHGNTLEELHLDNDNDYDKDNPMDFWGAQVGPFPNLTELDMRGEAYAFSFHFLNKLPNLKVLRLEQLYQERMLKGTNWTDLKIMPHLREFYFIVTKNNYEVSEEGFLSEEDLERFPKIMPNLQCFTGQLTKLTLRVVCRHWRQLRKLVILSGRKFDRSHPPAGDVMDIDDVGITGIVRGSDERVPCVADLQELCHLTLEHVTLIGDTSVFGFLKLPKLISLDICERNEILAGLEPLKRHLQGGLTITPLC